MSFCFESLSSGPASPCPPLHPTPPCSSLSPLPGEPSRVPAGRHDGLEQAVPYRPAVRSGGVPLLAAQPAQRRPGSLLQEARGRKQGKEHHHSPVLPGERRTAGLVHWASIRGTLGVHADLTDYDKRKGAAIKAKDTIMHQVRLAWMR